MDQGEKDFFIALGEVYGPGRGAWLPQAVEIPTQWDQIEAERPGYWVSTHQLLTSPDQI